MQPSRNPLYVRVPSSLGKVKPRQKVFFTKEAVAKAFRDKLLRFQVNADQLASGLTEAQRVEASECFAMLAPKGKSLRAAVEFFVNHLEGAERSTPLSALVVEVVEAKRQDKFTVTYIAAFQSRLKRSMGKEGQAGYQGERLASEFTATSIEDWMRENVANPTTRNNFRRDLRTMFAFSQACYVTSNPVAEVSKAKQENVEVEALMVSEVARDEGCALGDAK